VQTHHGENTAGGWNRFDATGGAHEEPKLTRDLRPPPHLTPGRAWVARFLAIAADVVQIVGFPLFAGGAASPWNDALDLLVAGAMTLLIGWHWAFLPSFFAELVPGLDLVPTWTLAVFFATRAKTPAPAPPGKAHDVIDVEVVGSEKPAR
jgi:hypothetical protein